MKSRDTLPSRTIVHNIRSVREAKHYSQEYVARKMGISQEAYSRLELNETTPTLDRLLLIARILDIRPEDMFFTRS